MEKLDPEHQLLGDLILQLPAEEPVVVVSGTRIDPEPAAPVRLPTVPEALLNPHRQEHASLAGAKAPARVARRRFKERKHSDHRRSLALLKEPKFRTELGVAVAIGLGATCRIIKCDRPDDVELKVRRGA